MQPRLCRIGVLRSSCGIVLQASSSRSASAWIGIAASLWMWVSTLLLHIKLSRKALAHEKGCKYRFWQQGGLMSWIIPVGAHLLERVVGLCLCQGHCMAGL